MGRAIAYRLAALGAHIGVLARREEPLVQTVSEIERAGAQAAWATADIRDEEQVVSAVERLGDVMGGIDILVNNAGGQYPGPADRLSARGFRAVIDLNLTGTFLVTKAVADRMAEGAIVSVLSNQVDRGGPGVAHSAAARAGVANLTRTLAVEWAPRIRVNAIATGFFPTDGARAEMLDRPDVHDALLAAIPMRRYGHPDELANVATFLASPASSYVTGAVVFADGGNALDAGLMPLLPLWFGEG